MEELPVVGRQHRGARRDCHIAGPAGGHGCKGTECALFEAAASPGPEVRLPLSELLVDGETGFGPLGTLRCGPHQCAGPCTEEGPRCKVVVRVLGEDARRYWMQASGEGQGFTGQPSVCSLLHYLVFPWWVRCWLLDAGIEGGAGVRPPLGSLPSAPPSIGSSSHVGSVLGH